jgi:hypothetical protein
VKDQVDKISNVGLGEILKKKMCVHCCCCSCCLLVVVVVLLLVAHHQVISMCFKMNVFYKVISIHEPMN